MCIIVHQPAGSYLSKPTAKEMWARNSDGGGFAYIKDDEIVIDKAMNFDKFWSKFETHRSSNRDLDFLVHMRIATSGKIGLDNTHPFQIDEHTVMAHNGMLNHIVGSVKLTDELSDTREFIDLVLPELPEDWLDNPVLFDMMEDYIGGSKLLFLTKNPKLRKNVYILNERSGTNKHNMWWSNTSHEQPKHTSKRTQVSEDKFLSWGGWTSEAYESQYGTYPSQGKKAGDATVYKLPLPSEDAMSERELSEREIEEFWIRNSLEIIPQDQYTESEKKQRRELIFARGGLNIDHDIYLDADTNTFTCAMCLDVLTDSGDCMCWELICVGCGRMAPYCIHDPVDAELVPVNEAHKAYADKEDPY